MKKFDLHTHSTFSDGVLTPTQLLHRAKKFGVQTLALADHDTVAGLPEAQRAANRLGIQLIPAIEITARYKNFHVHVVGLNINPATPALRQFLAGRRTLRLRAAKQKLTRLQAAGFRVSWSDITAVSTETIARPNIARAVIRRKENAARLMREFGHMPNVHEFIQAYIVPGAAGYTPSKQPTLREVIGVIHKSGGLAVLAHPLGLAGDKNMIASVQNPWPVLRAILKQGFDGVEFYYQGTEPTVNRKLLAITPRRLLLTGGSDFHDPLTSPPLGHYQKTKKIPASVWTAVRATLKPL
jgi:predicted metal-dependent phosphoesterase TrpH